MAMYRIDISQVISFRHWILLTPFDNRYLFLKASYATVNEGFDNANIRHYTEDTKGPAADYAIGNAADIYNGMHPM